MSNEEYKAGLSDMKQHVEECMKEHKPGFDSALYNGGTLAVILFTAAATFLFGLDAWSWIPRVLTGIAAFWIAMERALNFGARWRFHLEMKKGYEMILVMINSMELLPEGERRTELEKIRRDFFGLLRRESAIPGGPGP